jgi:hypothetical protein
MPLSWGKPHLEPVAAKHSKPDLDLLGQIAPGQGLTLHGWPRGANPEMARKAVLSEGRTLRVRVARPCPCRGIT